ncbi:MAG: cupin domain-containing protein [Acidimicrobiales bacterium]
MSDPRPHIRRVVVSAPGVDHAGGVHVDDDDATAVVELPAVPGTALVDLWRSDVVPLDLGPTDDPTATPFALMPTGSLFRVIDLGPTGDAEPMWHRTDSVDFIFVASGCCSLLHRDGRLDLGAGDTVVVRGVEHAWVNEGDEVCRLVDVSVAATGGPVATEEER